MKHQPMTTVLRDESQHANDSQRSTKVRNTVTQLVRNTAAFLLLVPFAACAAATPPDQLVRAREAYQRASEGPASRLTPAQLHTARQSLDVAEKAFEDDPEGQAVIDYAYIAERKAELAHFEAKTRSLESTEEQARDQSRKKARGALRMTKKQLAEERRNREKTAEELAEEKKARKEAEKRAAETMERLKDALQKIATIKEESRGTVITLSGSVLFKSGKYDLMDGAKTKLSSVTEALQASERPVTIEGHTDSRGSDSSNMRLSQRRAESVRTFFISEGVSGTRITATGVGEDRPIASNDSAEGRANNRRVEIIIGPAPEFR